MHLNLTMIKALQTEKPELFALVCSRSFKNVHYSITSKVVVKIIQKTDKNNKTIYKHQEL